MNSFRRAIGKQRRRGDDDRRLSEAVSRAILDSLEAQVVVVDDAGTVVVVNDAWKRFAAAAGDRALNGGGVGANWSELCVLLGASADVRSEISSGVKAVLSGSQELFALEYPRRSAPDDSWFLIRITRLSGSDPGGVIYNVDISERKRAEQSRREEWRRDRLTGALNHGAITDVLRVHTDAAQAAGPLAIIMADLDGLRTVNDAYGHAVGDAALVAVSKAMALPEAIVGRYGGDEFVAILPAANRAAATRYRRGVQQALAGTRISDPLSGSPLPLKLHIGMALFPDDARDPSELLRLADAAMYSSRRGAIDGSHEPSHPLDDARAAATISEIVPLLAAKGELGEKLRQAVHRVRIGIGYDLVGIEMFELQWGTQVACSVVGHVDGDDSAVLHPCRRLGTGTIRRALEGAQRPLLVDSSAADRRLNRGQRTMLARAGIRSVLLVPILHDGRTVGLLSAGSREPAGFSARDVRLLSTIAGQVMNIAHIAYLLSDSQAAARRAKDAHAQTVLMLAAAAEAHDQTTGLHLRNVQALSEALARELGYADEAACSVGLAAVLHDIGKIRVAKEILLSADELSPTEWEVVKQHTLWGAEFLADRPMFEQASVIARCHHERWDGGGYPAGLRGEEIPEEAAIVTIVDAFDAMTHDRPYRPALAHEDAIKRIAAGSGSQFSPRLVEAFLRMHGTNQLASWYQDCSDRPA